jgi:hypothetical protein
MRKSLPNCGPGDTLTEFEFHSCVLCVFTLALPGTLKTTQKTFLEDVM